MLFDSERLSISKLREMFHILKRQMETNQNKAKALDQTTFSGVSN